MVHGDMTAHRNEQLNIQFCLTHFFCKHSLVVVVHPLLLDRQYQYAKNVSAAIVWLCGAKNLSERKERHHEHMALIFSDRTALVMRTAR